METILITGGAGFIGSNFIIYLLNKNPNVRVINLDKLTYAGDLNNLSTVQNNPRHIFVQGDICDRPLIEELFGQHDIRGVIHFAAESHVDNSISGPGVFVQTNITGTFTLLDVARESWMAEPFVKKSGYEHCRFHHISTDEVYGSLGETGRFTEESPYAPNSPYSASKASSDMLVRSYHHTYGLNTLITNCSNNYGQHQNNEKLIPTVIYNALTSNPIPIYGDGRNIRDWLYVEDHCSGIEVVYEKGQSGEVYNIGGDCEKTNLDLANEICICLDRLVPRQDRKSYSEQISFVNDRPGHDRRYAIDASKIQNTLGWQVAIGFKQGLERTLQWYIDKFAEQDIHGHLTIKQ